MFGYLAASLISVSVSGEAEGTYLTLLKCFYVALHNGCTTKGQSCVHGAKVEVFVLFCVFGLW